MNHAASDHPAARATQVALEALQRALLGSDAAAIEQAARNTAACLAALERERPPAALLQPLAAANDKAGALVAARQAAVGWALARLSPDPSPLYDAAGQPAAARAPRKLASA